MRAGAIFVIFFSCCRRIFFPFFLLQSIRQLQLPRTVGRRFQGSAKIEKENQQEEGRRKKKKIKKSKKRRNDDTTAKLAVSACFLSISVAIVSGHFSLAKFLCT